MPFSYLYFIVIFFTMNCAKPRNGNAEQNKPKEQVVSEKENDNGDQEELELSEVVIDQSNPYGESSDHSTEDKNKSNQDIAEDKNKASESKDNVNNHDEENACIRGYKANELTKKCEKKATFKNGLFDYVWIQKAYKNPSKKATWWLRAATLEDSCPAVNGKKVMTVRAPLARVNPNTVLFPMVCQYEIKEGDSLLKVEGQSVDFEIPKKEKNVVFIGDTGCTSVEECGIFARVSNDIFSREELEKNSIVIHLGDYIYNHNVCESKNSCLFKGDNWRVWEEEVFQSLKKLITKFPLSFVRGNHEDCKQAYRGWYLFFDGDSEFGDALICKKVNDAFTFSFASHHFVNLDSAYASSSSLDHGIKNIIKQQMLDINKDYKSNEEVSILTHRPFFAKSPTKVSWMDVTKTLAATYREFIKDLNGSESHYRHVFSGHIHLAGLFLFDDPSINQIIVGNGGAEIGTVSYRSDKAEFKEKDRAFVESLRIKEGWLAGKGSSLIQNHGYSVWLNGHKDEINFVLANKNGDFIPEPSKRIANCPENHIFIWPSCQSAN